MSLASAASRLVRTSYADATALAKEFRAVLYDDSTTRVASARLDRPFNDLQELSIELHDIFARMPAWQSESSRFTRTKWQNPDMLAQEGFTIFT